MFVLDWKDTQLREHMSIFISALLPHENYDPSYFTANLSSIFKYIHLDEMEAEYYVLMSAIEKVYLVSCSFRGLSSYTPKVLWESIDKQLEGQLPSLVLLPEVNATSILIDEGFDGTLELEINRMQAQQLLYKRVRDLYKDCFDMEIPSSEAPAYLPAFEAIFAQNVSERSVYLQQTILKGELLIGRDIFRGPLGWLKYTQQLATDLQQRLDDSDNANVLVLDSIAQANQLLDLAKESYTRISDWGLPPMDDETPILEHRYTIVCADPNVGKTSFTIGALARALSDGKKVAFMCGETTQQAVLAKILSSYIYYTRQRFFTPKQIVFREELPLEKQRLINICEAELVDKKRLALVASFTFKGFYEEAKAIYDETAFDIIAIDHTYALKGGTDGNMYELLGEFSSQVVEFKKAFPVSVIVLSHLSTFTKEAIAKSKKEFGNPTKGNSSLTSDADEIFVLLRNETLDKENLLAVINTKRRDAPVVLEPMIITKKFNVMAYDYDVKMQNFSKAVTGNQAALLATIDEEFKDDFNSDQDTESEFEDIDDFKN